MTREALQALREGAKADKTTIQAALGALESPDRNLRVLALRILGEVGVAGIEGDLWAVAAGGIAVGLGDPKRRVRRVALQCSGPFLAHGAVAERIEHMVGDEGEVQKIRGEALRALMGGGGLPGRVTEALGVMMGLSGLRGTILLGLVQLDLTDEVVRLLSGVVVNGDLEEAAMATRALSGFKVVNLGALSEERRREVASGCDLAAGQVYYWVRRVDR